MTIFPTAKLSGSPPPNPALILGGPFARVRNPAPFLIGSLAVITSLQGAPKVAVDPATFHIDNRLEIQLWVAEPDVVDPVSMCFDENGVAYVAECRDYPSGAGPKGRVGSTIRRLEDTNGDGIPDRSTVFASGLSFVTSVTPWRGGILVAAPPDILFLKDTSGNGVADLREVRVSGFVRGVSDSFVNGLQFHFDNRIHGANGGSGGTIGPPKDPDSKIDLQGFDFSFDPDTGLCERTWRTGGGFGLVFDEWGHSFTTYNINHIQHGYINWRHLGLFPGFSLENATASISDHGEMARIYPVSAPRTRPNHPEQAGYFSAAGGMGMINSPAFPDDLRGSILVCDVVGNIVHRDVVHAVDSSFVASRDSSETNKEFIASTDPFFRPVGTVTGPDNALYLLAMQREIIEHPDYIPAKIKETANLRAGDDRGRIFRITPKGGLPPVKDFARAFRSTELVALLGNPNPWWRLTAQRLIVERNLRNLVPELRKLAKESEIPLARLHALRTLQGLKEVDQADVSQALSDSQPGIRENALIMAEPMLADAETLQRVVAQLAMDPDATVRFQAALTLGLFDNAVSTAALQDLLRSEAASYWTRQAVLSSLSPTTVDTILNRFPYELRFRSGHDPGLVQILKDLATLTGAREKEGGDRASRFIFRVDGTMSETSRTALLEGLADGLERAHVKPQLQESARLALNRFSTTAGPRQVLATARLARIFGNIPLRGLEKAIETAANSLTNSSLEVPKRLEHLQLLEFGDTNLITPLLVSLVVNPDSGQLQEAALRVLSRMNDPAAGTALVARWGELPPSIRPAVVGLLVERNPFHGALLDGLEKNLITTGELNLDLEQRRHLLRHGDLANRQRAAKFIRDDEYANRKSVIDEWLPKMPAVGDSAHGQKVFEELCSRCHQVRGNGHRVGPPLDSMAARSVEDVLSNVLDPNMAINPGFIAFIAENKSGETQTGLLASQSADSVTLLQANEEKVVVPRKDLKSLRSSGQSLMPEGLEAGRTPKDFRDLIAYVRGE